jgi:putative membrane protein
MKQLQRAEHYLSFGHIISMVFGLAGIILVLPNPDFLTRLSQVEWGQTIFAWSIAGGGVAYMLLGTAAISVYAYRSLGIWHWLGFMLPSVIISLTSELLGTSTGFPFGHYRYLSGLGYKIAGLVPFTIPLSWFYVGFSAYIIARTSLETLAFKNWLRQAISVAIGALCLTAWDFVLDPAMSQTTMSFWVWEQPGAFFGMPYQNFAGWMGTGVLFMTVASLFWNFKPVELPNNNLGIPLAIYLGNFGFATILSIAAGIYLPIFLGILLGILPLVTLYQIANDRNLINSELAPAAVAVDIFNSKN